MRRGGGQVGVRTLVAQLPRDGGAERQRARVVGHRALHGAVQQRRAGAAALPSAARTCRFATDQVAWAANGTLQLPPSARETARSACTASQVGRCVNAPSWARSAAASLRTSRPSAP